MHMSGNYRNRNTNGATVTAVNSLAGEKLGVTMRAQALHRTQIMHGDRGAAVRRQIMVNAQAGVNGNSIAKVCRAMAKAAETQITTLGLIKLMYLAALTANPLRAAH